MDRKISLITMGAGNVLVLKETLESFKGIVDEVVYGDMLIFPEDREILKSYQAEYNINIQTLPFNYIFQMGFSNLLNYLISNAKNDLCLYMNTSEVIDEDYGINKVVNDNPDCNTFYFSHRVEKHRWFRMNDRQKLSWAGYIHEECRGEEMPFHKPAFMMKDVEKDMGNPFKVKVLNSLKEAVYFRQYMRIVENPKRYLEATNAGWLEFSKGEYQSMGDRMKKKGTLITALQTGDYNLFIHTINNDPDFAEERFESSKLINFQGIRKDVL